MLFMMPGTGLRTEGCVLGIDLGATKTALGIVDSQGNIVARLRLVTRSEDGPAALIERITSAARMLEEETNVTGPIESVGICCPGPVDQACGTLVDPPNLSSEVHGFCIRDALSRKMQVPVVVEHDAKASALGEYYYGAGRGHDGLVYIVIGTGVGAAIIAKGELYRGANNAAGELGHITLDRNGELCSCGSRGCVETFMSGPWLQRRYQQALEARSSHLPVDEPITGESVCRWAADGDPVASEILEQAGAALGAAIASMAMILDIDLYVIGSSVAKAGDLLLEPARRTVPDYSYRSVGARVRIVTTELWDDGPILGCAWLARRLLTDHCVKCS
jgi:glucokinase